LLANRDARLRLAGQTMSRFGDRALYLALGIWVFGLTRSASYAGLTFFVLSLSSVAAPLAGLLADRVRRRPLLIATDLIVAASVTPLLLVHHRAGLLQEGRGSQVRYFSSA
jgi:MFS family permease